MFKKFMFIVKEGLSLDFFTMLKLVYSGISKGRIFFHNNSTLTFSKDSRITAKEGFHFNKSWTYNDPFPSLLHLEKNAKLIVTGKFQMYTGTRVYINEGASLILGSGFSNNNLNLSCFQKIEIGNNVVISENVSIRDSDNHKFNREDHDVTKPVKIGNHVWIGMNVTILKGVKIGDGTVVAAGSLVNKSIPSNCLCGGVPAKIIKQNVKWTN